MTSQQNPYADLGNAQYLDTVSNQADVQAYKHITYTLLGIQSGHQLLDVGCGTGEDVRALAKLVGINGRVVGLDIRELLITEARLRASEPQVEFRVGDIFKLDFADNSFDGCRADRVFQHLASPREALDEMMRVVRPGSSLVVADPDWETLVIDAANCDVTRKILNRNCTSFAQGWMGRQLPGLMGQAGLTEVTIIPATLVVTDFALADRLFFLTDTVKVAQSTGVISNAEAEAWLDDLTRAGHEARFFSALTLFVVAGRKS